jgi:hypothetical protein
MFPRSLFGQDLLDDWYLQINFAANGTWSAPAHSNYVRINQKPEEEKEKISVIVKKKLLMYNRTLSTFVNLNQR